MRIILASASARRKNILTQLGVNFDVIPSDREIKMEGTPSEVVEELSSIKAEDVASRVTEDDVLIIAADTVVTDGRKIFGKPQDTTEAKFMLQSLQNHTHQVRTGVTMILRRGANRETITFTETTDVTVRPMTDEEIDWYVSTGESMDKAGAYAIQGKFGPFIRSIAGDYYNVVGFPIGSIYHKLKRVGVDLLINK